MKTLLLIILISLAGCEVPTGPIATATGTGMITRDIIKKFPAGKIKLHEDMHNAEHGHCPDPKCLMYYAYQYDIVFGPAKKKLCEKCSPTTINWIKNMIKIKNKP